jgi:hypothetical protein
MSDNDKNTSEIEIKQNENCDNEMNNNVIETRKKGRPRKNTNENVEDIDDDKKKRGRKKKEPVEEEVKVKKKRGRKAALKYFSSSIRKQIPLKTTITDNENNILFLDIKDNNTLESVDYNTQIYDNLKDVNELNINELNLNELNLNELNKFSNGELNLNELNLNELNLNELNLNELNKFSNGELNLNGLNKLNTANSVPNEFYELEKTNNKDNDIITNDKLNSFNTMNDLNDIIENDIKIQQNNIKKGYFKMFNYTNKNENSKIINNDKYTNIMDINGWLEKTNVKCWWCCNNFDTLPLGIPVQYESKLNKFRVRGIFCSFACMLAYSNNTKKLQPKRYLINFLYKKLTGQLHINFKEAPNKSVLKEYGGHLTIEEYRKLSSEYTSYQMIEYPMYMSRDYLAEVDLKTIKQVNDKVFKNDTTILLDDKRIEEVKYRISKLENNTVNTNNDNSVLFNTIEDFIKN